MSHRLRPLRLFVLCCAAAAIAAPVVGPAARQPQASPAAGASPAPSRPAPAAPAKPPAQAAAAQPLKDPVVATVNGQPIRLSELEVAQQSLPQQYRNMPLQAVFPALLDRIVDSKLVVQEGKKSKVTEDPAFKKRMAFVEDQVLQDFWIQREIARQVTAEKLQKRYEERLKSMPAEEEVHARHILVSTEDEAKALDRRDQEGRGLRQARQGEVDRQGLRRRGRRSRLVQEVRHGEGIRRRRLRPEEGRADRDAGQDPVRLPRHQGRGSPQGAAAGVRGDWPTSCARRWRARR